MLTRTLLTNTGATSLGDWDELFTSYSQRCLVPHWVRLSASLIAAADGADMVLNCKGTEVIE